MTSCIVAEGYGKLPSCAACKQEIIGGMFNTMKNEFLTTVLYHPCCSKCINCDGYVPETTYKFRREELLCTKCYGTFYWPNCQVCNEPMDPRAHLQVFERKIHLSCYKCENCRQIMNPYDRQYMFGSGMFCTINCAQEKVQAEFKEKREFQSAKEATIKEEPVEN